MLKEHWEEGLRGLEIYQHRELPMYNADTPDKVAQVATDLAEAGLPPLLQQPPLWHDSTTA